MVPLPETLERRRSAEAKVTPNSKYFVKLTNAEKFRQINADAVGAPSMEWSHGPPAEKEPPKEEYKPETDLYQPEYEREDSYKSTGGRGHVTVKFSHPGLCPDRVK